MPEYAKVNGVLVPANENPRLRGTENNGEAREFLAPLCDQWRMQLQLAKDAKKAFDAIAEQCNQFFAGAPDFMWKPSYKDKYLGGQVQAPKFRVSINKAFDIVALYGPYLFWQYPQVFIRSEEPIMLDAEEMAAVLGADPQQVEPIVQRVASIVNGTMRKQSIRNRLMEKYLDYSQREQPGGGVASDIEVAVVEALVKGRSCLWPTTHVFPNSTRTLTKRVWKSVDRLLIDPQSKDPMLRDAKWIALRHDDTTWDFEKIMGLPPGFLEGQGSYQSNLTRAGTTERSRDYRESHKDMITWYEIWSRAGVGLRTMEYDDTVGYRRTISKRLHDQFDRVVGDYAYLVIADGLPYPANAPSWIFRDPRTNEPTATDEEIAEAFMWRAADHGAIFPSYMDDRWPVAVLDFYRFYGSAWPIAPLAPALGPLTILNILASAFTEQAYENRKTIIAYLESCAKDVQSALQTSDNPAIIPLNDLMQKDIKSAIQFLDRPPMNKDIMDAIPFIERIIEERTGLTAWMYATEVTKERSAAAARAKDEKVAVRPEKMSQDVTRWLTESVEQEKLLATLVVNGEDLVPLLGDMGAMLWDSLIASADIEELMREMRCTIEANDHRRPNRERLLANLRESMQFLLPILQQYAVTTGDTGPLNDFLAALNRSMEEHIMPQLGPWQPQPGEGAAQMQQAQLQLQRMQLELEKAKLQAEMVQKRMDVEKARLQLDAAGKKELARAVSERVRLLADEEKHEQQLAQREEDHEQKLQAAEELLRVKLREGRRNA